MILLLDTTRQDRDELLGRGFSRGTGSPLTTFATNCFSHQWYLGFGSSRSSERCQIIIAYHFGTELAGANYYEKCLCFTGRRRGFVVGCAPGGKGDVRNARNEEVSRIGGAWKWQST